MSGFTPLSRAQFRTIAVNQFVASLLAAGIQLTAIPDTGPDSIPGAFADMLSAVAEQLQYQAEQDQLASRLYTTPANTDGSVSSEAASYAAPWGIVPAPASYASSDTFQLNLPSVSPNPITVPCGVIIQRNDNTQYLIIADATQSDYNGSQGYTIPANTPYLTVTAVCLTAGSVGNVPDPTAATWSFYFGPGSLIANGIASITNTTPIDNGTNTETQAAFVERFTLAMQNGQWGVETAIIAAALGVQSGLTVSYGDHVNQDGSYHAAFFTLVAQVAGSAIAPSSLLLANITTALANVRSGGIEYQVVAPQLVAPAIAGTVAVYPSFNSATVLLAAQVAVQNYVNGIGLDQNGGTTTMAYSQALALMIGVPGVNPVGTSLSVNLSTLDVTAPFGSQIVCPNLPTFTVAS